MAAILQRMAEQVSEMSPTQAVLAKWIIKHPQEFLRQPVAEIAARNKVSEPTVIRLVRGFGYLGLRDFRLALAGELAQRGVPYVHEGVGVNDSTDLMVSKVFDYSIRALQETVKSLPMAALERAIVLLSKASRIELWGHGQSGIVAQDGQHKLFRMGLHCMAYSDGHVLGMAAALADSSVVVVAISNSGQSSDLLSSVRQAKASGAKVIALTRSASALARTADVLLPVNTEEDPRIYAPMATRLAHLTVLDALTVGVARALGEQAKQKLAKVKQRLQARKKG